MEDIFRNGFAGNEAPPPSRIWENVDRELELHRYKKQAVWYRSMAAAFLLLLVSAGIVLWQQSSDGVVTGGNLALQNSQTGSGLPPAGGEKEVTTPVAAQEPKAQPTPKQLAAVSGEFSVKESQNRESFKPAAREQERLSFTSPAGREKRRVPSSNPSSLALEEGNRPEPTQEGNRGERSTPEDNGTTFQQRGRQSLLNQPVPALAGGALGRSDSGATAPVRSILVQKEAEGAALALTQEVTGTPTPEKEAGKLNRWSVTMAYSPQYAYAPVKLANSSPVGANVSLAQPQSVQQYQQAVEEYNNSYKPVYSYSTTVGASYRINEKWQVESGLMYTQQEATTTHSYLVYGGGATLASMPGNLYSGSASNKGTPLMSNALQPEAAARLLYVAPTERYTTRYKYQQVGLPVRLAYRINLNKAYALISGGVNMNVLVQSSIIPQTNQVEAVRFGLNDQDSPYRSLQWATATSLGIGYDVNRKMSILVAPEFIYSLTPLVRDHHQQVNPYQLGVNIGGRWRLTK